MYYFKVNEVSNNPSGFLDVLCGKDLTSAQTWNRLMLSICLRMAPEKRRERASMAKRIRKVLMKPSIWWKLNGDE